MSPQGIERPNVSTMVRTVQRGKRVTHAVLARRMDRGQSTVARSISKKSIQTHVLWDFAIALKHNFFADLAHQFRTACPIHPKLHCKPKGSRSFRSCPASE